MPLQTNNRRIIGESPGNVYIFTFLFQLGELRVNGLGKAAIIMVAMTALAAFTLPSSAQLTSNSGYSSDMNNTSFSSFSGNIFSLFNNPPPLPGIFNGLGGWTGFGLGGIGGWGRGWCGGWSSAIIGLGCCPGPRGLGYIGFSPPIIPKSMTSATAPATEKGIANAPISSENGIDLSSS